MNVTHPCKQDVVALLDDLSPEAAALDAVNTVVFDGGRAIGHNTDASGFAESFRRGLPDAPLGQGRGARRGRRRLGRRARGAAAGRAGPGDRRRGLRPARAALAHRLGARTGALDELLDADGLIHATPTGMAAHPGLPLPEELLRPDLWVAEVVYRPLETELVKRARELGCRTLDGGGMAVMQAAGSLELFTGVAARPRAHAAPLRHD